MGVLTRVLVVEDEVIVAWDISESLRRLGYDVVGITARGEEAVDMATDLKPDLILMDVRLAGRCDGVEAAGAIREKTGRGVLFLTAHADVGTIQRAAQTDPLGYVFKPFTQEVLGAALERAVVRAGLNVLS